MRTVDQHEEAQCTGTRLAPPPVGLGAGLWHPRLSGLGAGRLAAALAPRQRVGHGSDRTNAACEHRARQAPPWRHGAFDIGAACTGFPAAMSVGCSQIEAGRSHNLIVVGADFMTRITDPADRATAAVFADGAGAALMSATEAPGRIGPIVLGADGDGAEHIFAARKEELIRMRGHETFKEAVRWLSRSTLEAVETAGLTVEDIDLFVYHQANGRILAAVATRLDLPGDRVVECIAEYGNTSAATLPLALAYSARNGRLREGDRVLLGAFGAGFTWGATVVEWGGR